MRPWVWAVALVLFAAPADAGRLHIAYNPYGQVDWSTTLRCQSQHHDHLKTGGAVSKHDDAGYCAITWMDYGGACVASTGAEWDALGRPDPDPGQPYGFYGYRRWKPTDHGAPALPGAYTNMKLYIPGAEEVGLTDDGSVHVYSLGLIEYIDGSGCTNCAPTDIIGCPGCTANSVSSCGTVADTGHTYSTRQELIDLISTLGGSPIIAHSGGQYPRLSGREFYNNLFALQDAGNGDTANTDAYMAAWDLANDNAGGGIWGVAVNDRYGANPLLADGNDPGPCGATGGCEDPSYGGNFMGPQDIDRGKLQVLIDAYDWQTYVTAWNAGAFFAIVENNATKSSYPDVTSITTTPSSVTITTMAGTETVTWVGTGGVTVGTGMTLDFTTLAAGMTWVRAEVADGAGRTLYTQPFSLGSAVPSVSPPGIAALAALIMLGGVYAVTRPRA